jgi:hypothetical protein
MELKQTILYGGIGLITFNLLLILFFFGLTKIADLFFMTTIYLAILVIVYFTYGVKTEELLIKRQINKFLNDTVFIISNSYNKISKSKNVINSKKINKKPEINYLNEENNSDKQIEIKNKEILNKTIILISITTFLGILLSFVLWIYINKQKRNYNIQKYMINIVTKNIIILLFVLSIQLIFTTYVTGNYIPLNTGEIYNSIIS